MVYGANLIVGVCFSGKTRKKVEKLTKSVCANIMDK